MKSHYAKGFTLIEVILAITILSTLTVMVATATNRAIQAKKKIQTEVEDVSALRDAMRIIKADINQAYNHYDYENEILNKISKPATTPQPLPPTPPLIQQPGRPQNPGATPSAQAPLIPPRENTRFSPATHFWGNENSLNFITMNNGRLSANEIQADFVEVGYSLKNCRSIDTKSTDSIQGSNCLYRRIQTILDSDVTQGGIETVILEHVSEFSLKYLVDGKLDWLTEWKSTKPSDNIFPTAVEVTLGIEKKTDGKDKKYSIQYVIPIHFPNNPSPSSSSKNNTTPSNNNGGITQ